MTDSSRSPVSNPAVPLLAVRGLTVSFDGTGGTVEAVRGVSFEILPREILGLVGESGSGKSLTALSIVGLAPAGARVGGSALLAGEGDLLALPEARLRRIRGARIGFVFQEPMTALNPVLTVGLQIAEVVRTHRPIGRREARLEAIRHLEQVAFPAASWRLDDYPHQLSGGQRQRALLALALAGEPDLLLADEPTTSLDLTLQAQMLGLLLRLREESGLAILLITHDLGVVAETCDRVAVMHDGEIVESAPVEPLFLQPRHPYTRSLLANLTVQVSPDAVCTQKPGEASA